MNEKEIVSDFLARWWDIKSRFDFKNPRLSTKEIFLFRVDLHKEIEDNPYSLAILRSYYRSNPIDFIEHWCLTYDPKRGLGMTPMVLFPKQEEFVHWLQDRITNKESGLVEKCREVGMSWLSLDFAIWAFIFTKDFKAGFGSRKADLVDKLGDVDSIFEKMRMVLAHIPKELLPLGFSLKKDTPYMQIRNPENGNSITGEGGENIGRGGRNSIYFKDESAFYEQPDKIEASLSENTDVQIDISTPNGVGNPFYKKRMSGEIPIFTFRWTDDPRKDQKWYDERVRKLGSLIVAREIDISYEASIDNITIPHKWVMSAVNLELEIKPNTPKIGGFDVAGGGVDKNALSIRQDSTVQSIEQWNDSDSVSATYEMITRANQNDIEAVYYDDIGVGDGAKGTLNQQSQSFEHIGISASSSPSDTMFEFEDKSCKEKFLNLRAEMWWKLRRRFEKTFDYLDKGIDYPHSELISIPNDPQLIKELCTPLYFFKDNGKIKIESKREMRARGVASPNMADAVIMSFGDDFNNGFLEWI